MTTPFTVLRTLWRLIRLAFHLGRGMLTVAFVYPCIGDARRLALKQCWSRQLVNTLGVTIKVGAGKATALQGGRAKDAQLCRPGISASRAGLLAVADGNTAAEIRHGFLVANHISFLDIFVINAIAPAAFVAKDDVRSWPLLGWLSRHTETIFLERGSRRAAQAAREHLVEQLRAGRLVAVFPEGTTSDGHTVHPFHAALFQGAIDAAVPVIPLMLRYTDVAGRPSHAADYVGDTSLVACLWSIASAGSLTAHAELLPLLPSGGVDRRHLATHAHRLIGHALKHEPGPGLNPSPTAGTVADTAGEISAGLPAAPPSMCRPKGSLCR